MPDSDPGIPPSEPSQGLPFDVQIRRGYRAVAAEHTPRELDSALSRQLSPRAERRVRRRFAFRVLAVLGLGLVGLFWLLSLPPQGALARVNGEYITMAQVDREILIDRVFSELTNNGQDVADTRTTILERLINQRVLAQAAIRGGMTISDADLDAEITRLPDQQQWTLAQLDTALARQGLSRADLRASIRDVVLVNRYIDNVLNRGATDQSQLFTRQNSWSTDAVRSAKIGRFGDPDGAQAPRAGGACAGFYAS